MDRNSVTENDVANGLRELGLQTGDVAFVHSSLSSFGHVEGGADAVVGAFLGVLGKEGTLAAPSFGRYFWEGPDQIWDRDHSPSLMGRISETVRTWPGARRSPHAPHPVAAIGALAEDLTERHNTTDFGFDSPFARLIELDAWIVLMGVTYNVCTLIHVLEERAELSYRHWVELEGTVVENGQAQHRVYRFMRRHEGVANDFLPLGEQLEGEGLVHSVTVGACGIRAFRARDLYDTGMRALHRDPLFLVSQDTRSQAAQYLPNFGEQLDRAASRAWQVLEPAHPVRARLARVLRVPQVGDEVAVEARNRWETEDALVLEELRLRGGPSEMVPGVLARPAEAIGPLPAVICLPGTSGMWEQLMERPFFARGASTIGWARELARRGFAALALTQLAQPPRPEPWNWEGSKLMQVYGQSAMGRLVADVLLALRYLEDRPEVDPDRVGVAGFSLGGIASFYAFAVEERLAAAVTFCGGVGSVREVVRHGSLGYHSVYYYVPGLVSEGLDHPQLVSALAPRPLLVCGAVEDAGMPVEGLREFERAAAREYADAGAGDGFGVAMAEGGHALTETAFEAGAAWLVRHLQETD